MDFSIYPLSFFLSAIVLIGVSLFAWKHRRDGWGLPMCAVLGTVAVWYFGDGLYNDYEMYRLTIGDDALGAAWWQVLLFVVVFACIVKPLHEQINRRFLRRRSHLLIYATSDKIRHPNMQRNIDQVASALLVCWIALMTIALARKGWNFSAMFFPYLEGYKLNPWSRGRVGGGISALLSLAGYVQIMLTAGFGVVAAVSTNSKTRVMAITVCFLAFPYYIFDRTRNPMIATMGPGLLAWVFIGLRTRMIVKAGILLTAFLLANFWFLFVVESNINRGVTVADALAQRKSPKTEVIGGEEEEKESKKHEGLSMYSELAKMNDLFDAGLYAPTLGKRYFAEVVNFVPRGLWKNKPLVGVDYALARGFGVEEGKVESKFAGGGITASIATGMIGQGVANFGRVLGPMCSALLMAIWVSILARLDLRGDPARLILCTVGMILTFNMGRDITLFVLYPFVFGYMLLLAWEWQQKKKIAQNVSASRRRKRTFSAR
jgi:hypothetical protein